MALNSGLWAGAASPDQDGSLRVAAASAFNALALDSPGFAAASGQVGERDGEVSDTGPSPADGTSVINVWKYDPPRSKEYLP